MHDLCLTWNVADCVGVVHRGCIVENGPVEQVLLDRQHGCAKPLLQIMPSTWGVR
jgi:peptide/nickel transport system ATP-binding protein